MSISDKYDTMFLIIRNIKQSIKFNFKLLIEKRYWKSYLKENKKFKNIHKGERCFILGNGPSLKNVDFSTLSEEYVFTVNQISRRPDYKDLKSNYHFWADELFFRLDTNKPEDCEVLQSMKNLAIDNKPVCFYPIEQIEFVENNGLNETMEACYFLSPHKFHSMYNKPIDYSGFNPGFGTVVQWCITMAIYMGFKEIYLLGCDTTGLINNIRAVADKIDGQDYGYKVTENEVKRYKKIMNECTLITSVEAYLKALKDYKYLFDYCSRHNINLVNLSTNTAIDSIPRNTLENVLNEKK